MSQLDPKALDLILSLTSRLETVTRERDAAHKALGHGDLDGDAENHSLTVRAEAAEARIKVLEATLRSIKQWAHRSDYAAYRAMLAASKGEPE